MNQTIYTYKDGLESSRLYTRFLTLEDIPLWTEFFKDPEATRFHNALVTRETPEASAMAWIERQLTRYKEGLYGHQALLDKETGEFVGMSGLILQDVDGRQQLEVGYHIMPWHWGKGYAPEAARMFIDYAFNEQISETVISIIVTDNIKSQRVADKNGLWREKQVEWKDLDVYIYRMNKDKWKR